jgi:hypothetical protein
MDKTQRKPGVPPGALLKDDYKTCFGKDGQRTTAQERIWKDLVLDPLLTTSHLESLEPVTARDVAIKIYKLVK